MTWVLDLDGVVWRGEMAIPAAAPAVARLVEAGEQVLFVTNNSAARVAEVEEKLGRVGIDGGGAVLSAATAAATLVEPGERVLVCAGPGVWEAVTRRGAEPVSGGPADAVVVGWHTDFTYDRLTVAFRALRAGARFIAANTDATYPVADGEIPGGGAIVAAVAYASGSEPVVAGKPHQPMAELVRARARDRAITVVGDRPETDGRFAQILDARFVLVLSGVTDEAGAAAARMPRPDHIAAHLGDAVHYGLQR